MTVIVLTYKQLQKLYMYQKYISSDTRCNDVY